MSAELDVIKELADALRLLADKDGRFHNWESGEGEVLDDKLNQALDHAEAILKEHPPVRKAIRTNTGLPA